MRNRLQAEQPSGSDPLDDFAGGGSPPPLVSPLDSPKYNASQACQMWAMDAYADERSTEEEMVRLATQRSLEDSRSSWDESGWGDEQSAYHANDSWEPRPSSDWSFQRLDGREVRSSDAAMPASPYSSEEEYSSRSVHLAQGVYTDEEVGGLLQKNSSRATLEERLAMQRRQAYHRLSDSDD